MKFDNDFMKRRCIKVYKDAKSSVMVESKEAALNWLTQAAKVARIWKNTELESMALSFSRSLSELIHSQNIETAWTEELEPNGGI